MHKIQLSLFRLNFWKDSDKNVIYLLFRKLFCYSIEMDDNNNTNNDNNTNNNIIWQMVICHAGVLYYIKVKSFDMKTF